MTDKAKRLGNQPANSEMYFSENGEASDYCTFKVHTNSGLTKREYFASMAMQGIIAEHNYFTHDHVAVNAVAYADALLDELSK
jgi:hypothetical protein